MQMNKRHQKRIAVFLCLLFCFSLIPVTALAAIEYNPIVSAISDNYFMDIDNQQTNKVGEVQQFYIYFSNTSDTETVIITLPSSIPVLAMSAQPDKDKIEKIVSGKASTRIYMKPGFDTGGFTIRFAKPLTVSGDYVITVTVDSTSDIINKDGKTSFTVRPDEAVIVNPQISSELLIKSYLRSEVDIPLYDEDGYVTFEGTVRLYLKDQYNNATNILPSGMELHMKFDRNNRAQGEYELSLSNGVTLGNSNSTDLLEDYLRVNTETIPDDAVNMGQIEVKVTYKEKAGIAGSAPNVPRIYAALAYQYNGQIDSAREIYTSIGFLEENSKDPNQNIPSIYMTGDISLGSSSNTIYIVLNGVFPAAGKQVILTLPKGFINIETQSNKVYFDYDDIGKTKTITLSDLPSKVKPLYTEKDISLAYGNKINNKVEKIGVIQLFSELNIINGPATNGNKGSYLVLENKKSEAKANRLDEVKVIAHLQDSIGQIASKIDDSYSLYIWAEREKGKVSTVDFIVPEPDFVNTGDVDDNGIPLYEDNGINGIYRCNLRNLPENGEIPFSVTSSEDGKTTLKAAIATSAYYALYMEEGVFNKSINTSFLPYADINAWKFSGVTVKGLKTEYLQMAGKEYHAAYTVLETKKDDGTASFDVSAMLSPWTGSIKLGLEPITITALSTTTDSLSDVKITSKDKSAVPLEDQNGLTLTAASSGKFSFNISSNKSGTYKLLVQADNAGYKDTPTNSEAERSGQMTIEVTFDKEGGNVISGGDAEADLIAKLQTVTSVVLEDQSNFLLAPTDTLYATFKLYDKNKKQVELANDSEVAQAIKNLRFTTKPTDSTLENTTESIKATEDEGGIRLSFVADEMGAYALEMTLINNKTGKASFNVDQMNKVVDIELVYPETGLPLGGTSSPGKLVFIDSGGKRTERALPMQGIRLTASGSPLENFAKATSIVKVRKGDSYSGEIITVKAEDTAHGLTASHEFVVGHQIITLEFSETQGQILRELVTNATMKDSNGRTLPANSLVYDDGARVRVSVVSKPTNAVVTTELVNNGRDFIDLGNNDLKVRCDRVGEVKVRVDVRAIDPNYSQKYPVYAYLTGEATYNFIYPGILDSQPVVEGYDNKESTLMYIGSTTYVSRGEIKTMDTAPFIENSRTFIPLRALANALDTIIYFDSASQKIYLSNDYDTVTMQIGVPVLTSKNKGTITTDVAPFIRDNRTYLPIRAISETLNCDVDAIYENIDVIGVIFAKREQ